MNTLSPARLPLVPTESRSANPFAERYLTSLGSPNSRKAAQLALVKVATLVADVQLGKDGDRMRKAGKRGARVGVPLASVPWADLTVDHCLAARAALAAKHAPATASLCMAALRGVLLHAGKLDEAMRRATKAVRGESAPRGRDLSLDALGALLGACAGDAQPVRRRSQQTVQRPAGARDGAVLALLASGLRRSEACALDLADYSPGIQVVRVTGKGRKQRDVPLHAQAAELIDRWLVVRGEAAGPLLLALNRGGTATGRMSPHGVWKRVQLRAAQAGVGKVAPHDFRRWIIGSILDAGGDLSSAARLAGHSSVVTTQRYDLRAQRRVRHLVDAVQWPAAQLLAPQPSV